MSTKQNDVWLEDAKMNFEEALEVEDFTLCRAIIADCRTEGFDGAANTLEKLLVELQDDI